MLWWILWQPGRHHGWYSRLYTEHDGLEGLHTMIRHFPHKYSQLPNRKGSTQICPVTLSPASGLLEEVKAVQSVSPSAPKCCRVTRDCRKLSMKLMLTVRSVFGVEVSWSELRVWTAGVQRVLSACLLVPQGGWWGDFTGGAEGGFQNIRQSRRRVGRGRDHE